MTQADDSASCKSSPAKLQRPDVAAGGTLAADFGALLGSEHDDFASKDLY